MVEWWFLAFCGGITGVVVVDGCSGGRVGSSGPRFIFSLFLFIFFCYDILITLIK